MNTTVTRYIHCVCVCVYVLSLPSVISGTATTSLDCKGVGVPGQSATLVCTVTGAISNGINWFRPNGGSQQTVVECNYLNTICGSVGTIPGYSAVISSTQITLTIESFNSQTDAGTWMCCDGLTQTPSSCDSCEKDVIKGPDYIRFNPTSPRSMREGGDFTVSCTSVCTPACSYTWKQGNTLLSSNSQLQLIKPSRGRTEYTCTATNTLDTSKHTSGTFQLTVYYGPDNVQVNTNSPLTVDEGGNIAVTCSADCYTSSCSYTWKFKSQTYNSAVLSLNDVHKSQSGVYTCTAVYRTDLKSADQNFTLNVQYQTSITSLTFNSQSSSVTVDELTRVTLSCDVDSNPASHIKLYNNSHILTDVDNSKTAEYSWNEAGCMDTGRYTCEANNNIKSAVNQSMQLIVTCSPRLDHRVTFEDKFATSVGEDVTLSISVIVNPAPKFTWYRLTDKKNLGTRDPVSTTDVSAVGSYTITNVQEKDLGTYQVVVTNSASRSNLVKNFAVVAQEPPTIPSDVIVWKTGPYSISVSWIEEFNGGKTQTFLVQYRDDSTTEWKNLTQQFTQTSLKYNHTAEISNLQPNTRYLVRVLAFNSEGNKGFTAEQETLTDESTSDSSLGVGAGIGIGIGILLVIVLLVAGLIFTYSRIKTGKSSEENTYDSRQFQAEIQESTLYDDLGQTQGDVSTNVSDSYSTLETRKETLYEVLTVYENSQIKQGNEGDVSTNVSDSYSTLETRKETPYKVLTVYENFQIKQASS